MESIRERDANKEKRVLPVMEFNLLVWTKNADTRVYMDDLNLSQYDLDLLSDFVRRLSRKSRAGM